MRIATHRAIGIFLGALGMGLALGSILAMKGFASPVLWLAAAFGIGGIVYPITTKIAP